MIKINNNFLRVLMFIAGTALFAAAVMFLWNVLLPGIAGLPVINYWQAAGLLVLARILFGGIDGRSFQGHGHRNPFRESWMNKSPAEREAFHERYGRRHRRHRNGEDGEHKEE